MKRAEYLLLLLPLLFLSFCGGYFLGTARETGEVTILTSPTQQTQPRSLPAYSATAREENGESAARININTATAEELMTLPGIGETLAGNIVNYRQSHGLFSSVEELDEVPGIGEKRLAQLRDLITVEDENEDTGSG